MNVNKRKLIKQRWRQKIKANPERHLEYKRKRREKLERMKKENPEKYAKYLEKKRLSWKKNYPKIREKEILRKREWRKKNLERDLLSKREDRKILRQKIISAYGGKCACCGESRIEFLGIDHIGGGGNKHRKSIKNNLYSWLVKQNFPKGFRMLCHNCNQSLGHYGYCPHNLLKKE
jgi:hypothetical protein